VWDGKMRILNLGCGTDKYGTDRIDFVKTNSTNKIGDLNLKLDYNSNIFDSVYCKNVLEHIKNLDIFTSECYRVLKPNGHIYIKTDYAGYLPMYLFKSHEHNRILEGKDYHNEDDAHYHLFVKSHLIKMFKRFKNIRITYEYCGKNMFNHLILRLLPFKLGAKHIIFSATK
jgi:predicted SAM-dependent methyltransferase